MEKATTKKDIVRDVQILKNASLSDDVQDNIKRLEKAALDGISTKNWIRRFFLGFGLADAVEKWLANFKPSPNKPIQDQIPKPETKEVIAAWVRHSITIALISSSISLIPVYFLYLQIVKQEELITLQSKINEQDKRLQYTQILYEQHCEIIQSKNMREENTTLETCKPKYNSRQRREAIKAFVLLEFPDVDLSYVNFSEANFPNIKLNNVNLSHSDFHKAELKGAIFDNSLLYRAKFTGSHLRKATFINSDLTRANLSEGILENSNMSGVNLTLADLRKANLKDVKLSDTNAKHALFDDAKMHGADLTGANLELSRFYRVSLLKANLSRANIRASGFQESDLSFSNLRDSNLTISSFESANLYKADLQGANFSGTNLQDANMDQSILFGAGNLTCKQLTKSKKWNQSYRDSHLACGASIPISSTNIP